MTYELTVDGEIRRVEVERLESGHFRVVVDGVARDVDLLRPSAEAFQMLIDGMSWEAGCVPSPDGFLVDVRGVSVQVDVVDPRRRPLRLAAAAGGGLITSQMPGRIVKRLVPVGDPVRKGQPVLVIEAMKMENEIKSPVDGRLVEVLVNEGDTIEAGTRLARVEALG